MQAARWFCLLIVAVVIALLALPLPVPAQNSKPKRVVWKGVETFENAYKYGGRNSGTLGLANDFHYRTIVSFSQVQESDAQGHSRIVSHKVAWSSDGQSMANGYETTTCSGSGSIELVGMSDGAARAQMKIPCETRTEGNFFGFFPKPPDHISVPKVVRWEDLRESCSYAEEQTAPNGEHHTYSAWVAADIDAVLEAKTDRTTPYWGFVPQPGGTITFAVHSNVPARFRFKLEEVSSLYGFAGNAAVDDDFFDAYPKLANLKGRYDSRGPDLIFNPEEFKDAARWQAPADDLLSIETAKEDQGATVTITAMDYAASGKLRVEAKGKCGGWEPVRIIVDGKELQSLAIPLDENNNLIADRMEQPDNGYTNWAYAGETDSDSDELPKGDGTPGDGLTLFEEYRGFMTASAANADSCKSRKYDTHVRTDPMQKDIFIITEDLELAQAAPMLETVTRLPGTAKGVAVHMGCDIHHLRRTINFSLSDPQFGPKQWRQKTLSRDRQHGLLLHDGSLDDGRVGQSIGNTGMGPPKNICEAPNGSNLTVDKAKLFAIASRSPNRTYAMMLASTTLHELGHGIGIDHNGDGDLKFTFLITTGTCPQDTDLVRLNDKIKFSPDVPPGATVCEVEAIARRHGAHSGNATSPMKYGAAEFYESPGDPLQKFGSVTLEQVTGSAASGYVTKPVSIGVYTGSVHKYRHELEQNRLGPFPDNVTGTGMNALPGEENHAGDSCRVAATQIHITDWGPDPAPRAACPAGSPPPEQKDICRD